MSTIIQKKRGTSSHWTASNPILAQGEEGFETDTRKTKTGDGVTAWNSLLYDAGSGGGGGSALEVQDEGTPLSSAVTHMNFVGGGVTVTEPVPDQMLVTIPTPPPGTVTSVGGVAPISVANPTTTPSISIANATTSAPGAMSAADKTKLNAITGTNTGDQTSIVGITGTVAEFNAALTGGDFATGGGTVTGASSGTNTGDQDGANIKSLYEAEPDTNAFTDAEKAKLAALNDELFLGTYASLSALTTAHPTATAGQYAHVDTGAGADVEVYIWDVNDAEYVLQLGASTAETAASIKTKYESNPDTNAYTNAEKAKVAATSGTNTGDQSSIVGITGTLAEFNAALAGADFASGGGVVTGNSSGTNTGDNSPNSLYSGLVTNATHTGDAAGATTLTLQPAAITGKSTVAVDPAADFLLFSDTSNSGALAKALAKDLGLGDVFGPGSSVDNEIARFNGATGKLLKAGLKYQAHPQDGTADALLTQFAYGMGRAMVEPEPDYNVLVVSGHYLVTGIGTNGPPSATSALGAYPLYVVAASNAAVGQISINDTTTGPVMAYRFGSAAALGGSGTWSSWIELPVSTASAGTGDMNTNYLRSGFYSVAAATANAPTTSAGYVFVQRVSPNPVNLVQIYVTGNTSSASSVVTMYMRTRNGNTGTWTPWSKLYDSLGQNLNTSPTGSIGFAAGAGGTITQSTAKNGNNVTLNKPCGNIITAADALAAGAEAVFTLINSQIGANDIVHVCVAGPNNSYLVDATYVRAGNVDIVLKNRSGGSLSQAVTINFVVTKGAIS